MIATNLSTTSKFFKVISHDTVARFSLCSLTPFPITQNQTMTKQEKIKAAEDRIKELEIFIKRLKKLTLFIQSSCSANI